MKIRFKFGLLLAVTLAMTISSCTLVSPKEAGFKVYKGGDYRGVDSLPLLTGINGYVPFFSEIVTISTLQQHVVWSKGQEEGSAPNQHIVVSCMGGAGFGMDVGLNWAVYPNKASTIYLKYGTDDLESISNTYLRNVVRGTMNEVGGTMSVDSLLNNLPLFEQHVTEKLRNRLEKEGFRIDLFNVIEKPAPTDPDLARSINDKIKAKQDVERKKLEEQGSIAEANKAIATARGDSASAVIRSSGEAEGIKVLQQVLSPVYVDYIKWHNADPTIPRVPSTVLGGGSNFLYSPK